jgi:hypothetical protein
VSWEDDLDPEQRKQWNRFVAYQREHVLKQMVESAVVMSIVPEEPDIKIAVELGMAIYLNKPIVLLALPGIPIPPKLERVADKIVSCDIDTEEGQEKLMEAIREMGITP